MKFYSFWISGLKILKEEKQKKKKVQRKLFKVNLYEIKINKFIEL